MLPCNFMVRNVAILRPQFCFGFVCLCFCVRSYACFKNWALIFTGCGIFVDVTFASKKHRCAVAVGTGFDDSYEPIETIDHSLMYPDRSDQSRKFHFKKHCILIQTSIALHALTKPCSHWMLVYVSYCWIYWIYRFFASMSWSLLVCRICLFLKFLQTSPLFYNLQ